MRSIFIPALRGYMHGAGTIFYEDMNIASTSSLTTIGELDVIVFMGITIFFIVEVLVYNKIKGNE